MAFRDGIPVSSQPGALPAFALDRVSAKIRDLSLRQSLDEPGGERSEDAQSPEKLVQSLA